MTIESALEIQVGGDHYKSCTIQPIQYIEANNLKFLEGCVVKRVTRHDKPTGKGRQDIEKAIHELQLVLELRYPILAPPDVADGFDESRADIIGQNGNDGEHYTHTLIACKGFFPHELPANTNVTVRHRDGSFSDLEHANPSGRYWYWKHEIPEPTDIVAYYINA